MSSENRISLVLPVYGPDSNWVASTISKLGELESKTGENIDLVVVDDGSVDKVPFEELSSRLPSAQIHSLDSNTGKGAALRAGFERCQSELMLFTDADFPYEIDSMAALIRELRSGADVVLGYREEDYYASVPWFRKGLSESFRFVLKSVLRFPITDTQCGLKGMNRKGRDIFLRTRINRFLVDMEFIKLAVKSKASISSCVVHLRPDVTFSKMGIGILLPESINFLRILFK